MIDNIKIKNLPQYHRGIYGYVSHVTSHHGYRTLKQTVLIDFTSTSSEPKILKLDSTIISRCGLGTVFCLCKVLTAVWVIFEKTPAAYDDISSDSHIVTGVDHICLNIHRPSLKKRWQLKTDVFPGKLRSRRLLQLKYLSSTYLIAAPSRVLSTPKFEWKALERDQPQRFTLRLVLFSLDVRIIYYASNRLIIGHSKRVFILQ